ncbi:MAG: alpha/beta fold hydrolase [Betaproteobacteria bacterium]|nr:alpha/beta fold hydrolase [Betaproteobacteria bacterium]
MQLTVRRRLTCALLLVPLAGCMSSAPLAERDAEAAAYIAQNSREASAALAPVPDAFTTQTAEWQDPARNRMVPVRIYRPAASEGALPLVVFSHGMGGSREGYRYLGRHFASNGFIAVHIQHVGSDRQVWTGNPLGLLSRLSGAANESEALDRVADVRFVLDQLLARTEGNEWAPRIDAQRILMAGHSYGANTAMLVSGARVEKEGRALALADPRIRAAILISAPPFYGMRDSRGILQDIAIPTLHITSTDDDITIPGYRSGIDDRIDVYQSTAAQSRAPKLLAVFKGGAHSMFTDRLAPGGPDLNPIVKTATRDLALQFANRVLNRTPATLAEWSKRHAPLVARFEHVGEMLR